MNTADFKINFVDGCTVFSREYLKVEAINYVDGYCLISIGNKTEFIPMKLIDSIEQLRGE